MARIYTKTTSRKAHTCGRTGHEIPAGEGYYAAAPGYRGREIYRCFKHPFRPSELTNSLRSQPLAALENLEDTLPDLETNDYDGLRSALEDFSGEVRSYAEERQSALDAWENGNSMLEELYETAENAANDAEAISDDIEEFEDEEPTRDEYDDEEEFELEYSNWEQARDEAWENAVSTALETAQNLEF